MSFLKMSVIYCDLTFFLQLYVDVLQFLCELSLGIQNMETKGCNR